ncbi:histidine phosphatase family protein [Kurthia sibirica]|uniref:Histidine phosphatase family protein n=1 Tax=Kurthia sibirica TaxID=202750 RepID=A0A2U3AKP7_9BACL|nr:histidine phosphatase family protein [Kurthia sibirica]PWI25084.1 histidine phosphatase family protein [Kurthia sibirica]GEK34002.1 phosphoglycerate mutase [Kurthia sibirica]
MKNIYIVRHCSADGQMPNAQLTSEGVKQAEELVSFFEHIKIERIISSTYDRALQTIEPLAQARNLPIDKEPRLTERIFSTVAIDDWQEKLKISFQNPDISYEGGESSREAQARIIAVMEDIFAGEDDHIVIVSHGNLIINFLLTINANLHYKDWQALSNPDVFLVTQMTDRISYERLWGK